MPPDPMPDGLDRPLTPADPAQAARIRSIAESLMGGKPVPEQYRGPQIPWDMFPPPQMDPHMNPINSGEDVPSDPPRGIGVPAQQQNWLQGLFGR